MPMSARDSADSALANAWTDAQSNEFAETYSEHDDESENMHAPTEPANESTSQVSSLDPVSYTHLTLPTNREV